MELLNTFVSWFVVLPDNVKILIIGLSTALIDLAFVWAVSVVPWLQFLEKYKAEWALVLATLIINWIENALPGAYPDLSILGVQFLVLLLLTILGKAILGRWGTRGFK